MAQPGDVIEHPRGEKIVFRETAAGSGGALLRFEYFGRRRLEGPPAHIHIGQEERFAVVSGTAGFRVAGKEQILAAGEATVVPATAGHSFWNAGDDELHMIVELRPAANMEEFFETLFRLGREGRSDERGRSGLLRDAQLAHEHNLYLAGPPLMLQKPAVALLAAIARMRGVRPR